MNRSSVPQIGLLYQPAPWLSVYGNYVQSLGTWGTSNVVATDIDGHPLPAQRSHSYEGGIKAEAFGGRLRSTLAVFDITKTNVATRDLASPIPEALRAIGEAHSPGVEVDITGAVSDRVSVIGTYAFTNATFSKDNSGLQGNRIANVPKQAGSVWATWRVMPQRLSIGGGLFLRGQREGDNENTFELPGVRDGGHLCGVHRQTRTLDADAPGERRQPVQHALFHQHQCLRCVSEIGHHAGSAPHHHGFGPVGLLRWP